MKKIQIFLIFFCSFLFLFFNTGVVKAMIGEPNTIADCGKIDPSSPYYPFYDEGSPLGKYYGTIDNCLDKVAIKENNPSLCHDGSCIEEIGVQQNNLQICDQIEIFNNIQLAKGEGSSGTKDDCYERVAVKTSNKAVCEMLETDYQKNYCKEQISSRSLINFVAYPIVFFIVITLISGFCFKRIYEKIKKYLLSIGIILYLGIVFIKFQYTVGYPYFGFDTANDALFFLVSTYFISIYILRVKKSFLIWKNDNLISLNYKRDNFIYATAIVFFLGVLSSLISYDRQIFNNLIDEGGIIGFLFEISYLWFPICLVHFIFALIGAFVSDIFKRNQVSGYISREVKMFFIYIVALIAIPVCFIVSSGIDNLLPSNQTPNADFFTLSLPPGWKFEELNGLDSYVGKFVGDGARLSFDYGRWSNPLEDESDPDHIVTYESINDCEAKIVVPKIIGQGTTGVYFADVDCEVREEVESGWQPIITSFQMSGSDLTASQQETALKIFHTIKFTK